MSNQNNLSQEDIEFIKDSEDVYKLLFKKIENAKSFKIGDYIIRYDLEYSFDGKEAWQVKKNSYGVPVKYKVITVSESGIPFIRCVDSKGNTHGRLISALDEDSEDYIIDVVYIKYELDPDYVDALLLDEEYEPSVLYKTKQQTWKEIATHNKINKIDTHDIKKIIGLFNTLSPGDILYTSSISHYLVHKIEFLTRDEAMKRLPNTGVYVPKGKNSKIPVLTVLDKNLATKVITADFFFQKSLYKTRPRSYKEINI